MSPAVLGRRSAALLALISAVLHGLSLTHSSSLLVAALMAVMVIGCLYCAAELWVRGTLRGWVLVAVMNLAMIGLHLPLMDHHHGVPLPQAGAAMSLTMGLATVVAVVEVLVAAVVLWCRTGTLPAVRA